jgi:hypothetical protein
MAILAPFDTAETILHKLVAFYRYPRVFAENYIIEGAPKQAPAAKVETTVAIPNIF